MLKRILYFAYGSLSYLIFLGTFLYAVCFIGNFGVPRTLDGAASAPLVVQGLVDADRAEAGRAIHLRAVL
jgi:hypothetical protein